MLSFSSMFIYNRSLGYVLMKLVSLVDLELGVKNGLAFLQKTTLLETATI